MPGSFSSVIKALTGRQRLSTPAELMAQAIAAHPPAQRAADDEEYIALFSRLATLAIRAYREPAHLPLAVTDAERLIVAEELGSLLNGVTDYLRDVLCLPTAPHMQVCMNTPRKDAIEIRVTT